MNKIVLVGCGNVGMAYAYSLLNQSVGVDELVLVDINKEKVRIITDLDRRIYNGAKTVLITFNNGSKAIFEPNVYAKYNANDMKMNKGE